MTDVGRDHERPGSLVDRVHEQLREHILSGEYAPGSRLKLVQLATEHGVSAIPVRDALQRLEAERLVRSERNRGATVTELSMADMRDIYAVRAVLEAQAIRLATPSADAATLDRARRALHDMGERFAAGDDRGAYDGHRTFHFSLYEPARSPWTMHLIQQLWTSAERYQRLAAAARPAAEVFVAEHAEILDAVVDGDAETAAQKLTDNLETTAALLSASPPGG